MVKMVFIKNASVDDFRKGTPDEEKYSVGQVVDMNPKSAEHWRRRGMAQDVVPGAAVSPAATPAPAATTTAATTTTTQAAAPPANVGSIPIPADYASLSWPKMRDLSQSLSGAFPNSRTAAVAVIEAELARRKANAGT